jgi:hypothetical protein
MGCLVCGGGCGGVDVKRLCRECAQQVPPFDKQIPEQVQASVKRLDAEAWLVDTFGGVHAIAARTLIGRSPESDLAVFTASVSREHAEIRKVEAGWQIHDKGSHNGTFVGGTRLHRREPLPARSVIKVGDVAFWFVSELASAEPDPPSMQTNTMADVMVRYFLHLDDRDLCLLGDNIKSSAGRLLVRPSGGDFDAKSERKLPPLEFQLLRALSARALEQASSPAAVRGCVPTRELARDLPFQTRDPDELNVRQAVHRVRAALAAVGGDGILDVEPGQGYYLNCCVTLNGSRTG